MFIDIETTGLDFVNDSIVQLSYIYRVGGKIIRTGDIKRDIYSTFVDHLDTLVNRFDKEDKIYFIAYNAGFDNQFVRNLFLQNNNKFFGSYFIHLLCV